MSTTKTYNVPNINCNHCVHTIQSELSEVKGVQSVKADLSTKKVTVVYEQPTDDKELITLLTEINYPPA